MVPIAQTLKQPEMSVLQNGKKNKQKQTNTYVKEEQNKLATGGKEKENPLKTQLLKTTTGKQGPERWFSVTSTDWLLF